MDESYPKEYDNFYYKMGWLKKSQTSRFGEAWGRRFCRMNVASIQYFKTPPQDPKALGEISLTDGCKVEVMTPAECASHSPVLPQDAPEDSCFSVTVAGQSGRKYVFIAENTESRAIWVERIGQVQGGQQLPEHLAHKTVEGYMTKLGSKVKNWKRRYFKLYFKNRTIYYFGDKPNTDPIGDIVLAGSRVEVWIYPA